MHVHRQWHAGLDAACARGGRCAGGEAQHARLGQARRPAPGTLTCRAARAPRRPTRAASRPRPPPGRAQSPARPPSRMPCLRARQPFTLTRAGVPAEQVQFRARVFCIFFISHELFVLTTAVWPVGRGLEWDRRREIAGAWRDGLAHGGIVLSARRPGALGRARVSLSGRPLPAVHTRRRAAENAIICPQRPRHTPPKNGRACAQPGARAGRSAGALSQGAACVWARRHRRAGAVRRPGRATQPYSPHCSPPPL